MNAVVGSPTGSGAAKGRGAAMGSAGASSGGTCPRGICLLAADLAAAVPSKP